MSIRRVTPPFTTKPAIKILEPVPTLPRVATLTAFGPATLPAVTSYTSISTTPVAFGSLVGPFAWTVYGPGGSVARTTASSELFGHVNAAARVAACWIAVTCAAPPACVPQSSLVRTGAGLLPEYTSSRGFASTPETLNGAAASVGPITRISICRVCWAFAPDTTNPPIKTLAPAFVMPRVEILASRLAAFDNVSTAASLVATPADDVITAA